MAGMVTLRVPRAAYESSRRSTTPAGDKGETTMDRDRRAFLKTTSLAAAAAAAGLPVATETVAQARSASAEMKELPKGLVLATLRRADRGILDVVAAEQDFREGAPTTIDALLHGQGDANALRRLAEKARASASADRYFVALDQTAFGPCVTNPEKIVCIGLNYRRHAAETGNPVPKQPILFNKYNTALNCHGGTIGVSEEDAPIGNLESSSVKIGSAARLGGVNIRKSSFTNAKA